MAVTYASYSGGSLTGTCTGQWQAGASVPAFAWQWASGATVTATTSQVVYFPVAAYSSGSTYWPYPSYQPGVIAGGQRAGRRVDEAAAARHRAVLSRARERARELLLSLLDEEQARTYERDGWFEVLGSGGGLFRIRSLGQAGNVEELIAGRAVASYCCHPPGGLPDADAHVAQMLHLQTDEAGFRRTANRTMLLRRAA